MYGHKFRLYQNVTQNDILKLLIKYARNIFLKKKEIERYDLNDSMERHNIYEMLFWFRFKNPIKLIKNISQLIN
jgi:hypothetical protein